MKINRVVLIVLDSVGIGAADDAHEYGDLGANTLGHIGEAAGLNLPNLAKLGLGNLAPINGIPKEINPIGAHGIAVEKSKGKDTTTGHWEIAGQIIEKALPSYPNGFPEEIISEFEAKTGKKVIGNKVASGTAIIEELGDEHVKTGDLIVYTSADSVFQIAAHEEIVPIDDLYRYCQIARDMLDVGRVIARPFIGESDNYQRTSNRHDYSLEPDDNMHTSLKSAGKDVIAVGKIYDIYAGKDITEHTYTKSNQAGIDQTIEYIKKDNSGLIFTNLVDFDMLFGHRRDVLGYKNALEYFDKRLPEIMNAMNDDDLLIITADHGNDPIFKGTDHTRENVPVICYNSGIKPVNFGIRHSFTDISATILETVLNQSSENSFATHLF